MKKTEKHFVKDKMVEVIRKTFKKRISDTPIKDISDLDSVMSAFAIFSFKYPSLLQFDKARQEDARTKTENLKQLFKVRSVPCDTYMRERVDNIDPAYIEGVFAKLLSMLQRQKKLEEFLFLKDSY